MILRITMVFALKVSSAGTKKANGIYYPSEHFQGDSPVYTKTGVFQDREDDDFLLWQFREYWFISTLKRGEVLGNYGKYFYCCGNDSNNENNTTRNQYSSANSIPPTIGWKVDVHGCIPAPEVTILQRKILPSTSSSSFCNDYDADEATKNNTHKNHQYNLHDIMERILFQEQWSDIHFHCPDSSKVLHAHKVILCASCPYFAKVFSDQNDSNWEESHPGGIWITSHSYPLMEFLLTFLYTGVAKIDAVTKYPLEVLSLSNEFQLPILGKHTEKTLIGTIDKYNVKALLQTSSQYSLYKLKESCFDFIQKNMINVLTDEDFMKLAFEDNYLWSELKSYLAPHESS